MTKKSSPVSRRLFIARSAALGASIATPAMAQQSKAPAIMKNVRHWRMSMTWPKVLPGLGSGAVRLGRRIEQMSDGKIKVKIYGGGELVPPLGVFDACVDGSLEMAHAAPYYWLSKNRSFAFFAAVPGGLIAEELNAWLYFGEGLKLMHELYNEFGLVSFPAGNTGTQMGGWFTNRMEKPEDFQGLKMRIPGIAGEIVAKLGAVPETIPGSELYTSLQSGRIDALEWVGPWNDMALGFHRIANYYYGPAFHEGGTGLELMINQKAYESLEPDLKRVVKAACAIENQLMLSEYFANNTKSFAELQKVETLNILPFPERVMKALFELSEQVVSDTASLGDINKRIYDSYWGFRKAAMDMGKVAEYGFMRGRYKV